MNDRTRVALIFLGIYIIITSVFLCRDIPINGWPESSEFLSFLIIGASIFILVYAFGTFRGYE